MKKPKIYLVILLLFFGLTGWTQNRIRYDGYYHTLSDSLNPFRYYLRFYNDGTVIYYCTAGKPEALLKWFSKNDNSSLKGRYAFKDSLLHFSVKNHEGEIVYEGSVLPGNRLWMDVKSLINKYTAKEEYFFSETNGLK